MDRWKSRGGTSQRRDEKKREDQRRERVRRNKMQVREEVEKSRNAVFFSVICGSEGLKSRLAKAAGAEPSSQMRDEKLHAVGARSTFRSKNVQSTPFSNHFWKLRCRKSAHRCGAKHISKSKWTKHSRFGPLLAVEMSKKCTPLWREAHFEVKIQSTPCSDHFWKLRSKKCSRLWREAHFEVKDWRFRGTFGRSDVVSRGGARKGFCTLSKPCGFCSSFNYNHYTTLHSTTLRL